jgi:hypothetical protein
MGSGGLRLQSPFQPYTAGGVPSIDHISLRQMFVSALLVRQEIDDPARTKCFVLASFLHIILQSA